MYAVRSTAGVLYARQERRYSAESINPRESTPGEARQRRVHNAIRVDSVPSCSWAPRGRAHELLHCTGCQHSLIRRALYLATIGLSVCLSVRLSHAGTEWKRRKLG